MSGCHRQSIRDLPKTEHRVRFEQPTEPGFYYARVRGDDRLKVWPVRVVRYSHFDDGLAVKYFADSYYPLHHYEWYGPVNDVIPI